MKAPKLQKSDFPILCQDTAETCYNYRSYLDSEHWRKFREVYYDSHPHRRCSHCNRKDTKLDLHHISYDNLGQEKFSDVRLLCRSCHDLAHNGGLKEQITPKQKKKQPKIKPFVRPIIKDTEKERRFQEFIKAFNSYKT